MRWWPFKRRKPSEETLAAKRELRDVKANDHEVNSLVDVLRRIRESDEFAKLLEQSFQDRRRR